MTVQHIQAAIDPHCISKRNIVGTYPKSVFAEITVNQRRQCVGVGYVQFIGTDFFAASLISDQHITCSMYIEEVESIWDQIADNDEWQPLADKISDIREMGQALRE